MLIDAWVSAINLNITVKIKIIHCNRYWKGRCNGHLYLYLQNKPILTLAVSGNTSWGVETHPMIKFWLTIYRSLRRINSAIPPDGLKLLHYVLSILACSVFNHLLATFTWYSFNYVSMERSAINYWQTVRTNVWKMWRNSKLQMTFINE